MTVPFGAVAFLLGWIALPRTTGNPARGFDWGGALLIGPALVLTMIGLNHIASWGLASPLTLGSLAAAGMLFVLLVRRERTASSPLITPRLFERLEFSCGAAAVSLAYALLYSVLFLMSFALEHGYGESPAVAGLRLALVPIALGIAAPLSHDIGERVGPRRAGIVAMLVCLSGLGLLGVSLNLGFNHYLYHTLAFLLIGAGLGLFVAPNNHAALAAVPTDLAAPAGALLNLTRVLGSSLGVAASASTLTWHLEGVSGSVDHWLDAARGTLPVLAVLALAAAMCARIATRPLKAS